jgi:hypothetical protein
MPNGRCDLHGGKSTGARTPEGLERIRKAVTKHDYYTAEAKAARVKARVMSQLLREIVREVQGPVSERLQCLFQRTSCWQYRSCCAHASFLAAVPFHP